MGKKGEHSLYRIGEAAALLDLKTCVLRFWEGEFPQLAPVRTPKGQRLYREEDMAVLRRIRSLLHEQGMTIDGARRVLAGEMAAPAPVGTDAVSAAPYPGPTADANSALLDAGMSRGAVPETVVRKEAERAMALREAVAELLTLRQLLAEPGAVNVPSAESESGAEPAPSSLRTGHAGAFFSPEGALS